MGFKSRDIQRYIPQRTPVAAVDINDIVARIKRFEALSVSEPLQLSSNAFGVTIGFDPDFLDSIDLVCFVQLKTSFGENDGLDPNNLLQGYKVIQHQDGSFHVGTEIIKFANLMGFFGDEGAAGFLIKFGGKYNDWVLAYTKETLSRWVTLGRALTSDDSSSDDTIPWTDNDDNSITGFCDNYFSFTSGPNPIALIQRFDTNDWRIVQIGNPCA